MNLNPSTQSSLESQTQPIQAPGSPGQDQEFNSLCLDTLPAKQLTWLWPQRIPSGKLTLLDGSPSSGTSLFALTLAAHISTGTPWPDGTPCPQGTVLLIAPHDTLRDTIIPRLQAADANLFHIILLTSTLDPNSKTNKHIRPFSLPADLSRLETTIQQHQAGLVIIDPCTAIPGLRQSLPALTLLADRTNCAILLTRSLNRPPANPLQAYGSASPILTAARSHLLLAPDPTDGRKHLFLTPKHSLCTSPDILSYEITASEQGIPAIYWLGTSNTTHLTRLCTGPIRSPQRQAILRFLHNSSTTHTIKDILTATCYDYEAGRKMLLRMQQAGELISPARGLYTTTNHPCLAQTINPNPSASTTTEQAHPTDHPKTNVPAVPCPAHHPQTTPSSIPLQYSPLTNDANPLSSFPQNHNTIADIPDVPNTSSESSINPAQAARASRRRSESAAAPPSPIVPILPPPSLNNDNTNNVPAVPTTPNPQTATIPSINIPIPNVPLGNSTNDFPSAIIVPPPSHLQWNPLISRPTYPFLIDDDFYISPFPSLSDTY